MTRLIREFELPALLRLYAQLHPHQEGADPDAAATHALWQTILANPNLRYYVYDASGDLVSTCTLTIVQNLTHNLKPYGLIENVVTDQAHRRRGFATKVIRHALAEAWAAGCYKVMLLTGSKNEGTLRFYESAGFQRGVKTGFIAYPE